MAEQLWHMQVREEIYSKYDPAYAYQSHSNKSKLYLFNVAQGRKPRRMDCLSDADIVVIDSDSGKITKIIEIESALNPKKIMGIVLITHLCNLCSIRRKPDAPKQNYDLKNIELEVVFKKAPQRSKKDLKLGVFKPFLESIIRSTVGCLSKEAGVIFTAHD